MDEIRSGLYFKDKDFTKSIAQSGMGINLIFLI